MTPLVQTPQPLTAEAFAPFGDIIEPRGAPRMINQGKCARYHDLATLDFSDGHAGISVFDAEPRTLPCTIEMVERHPLGSQAFLPLNGATFLVVVAEDADGTPTNLQAFIADPGQGINLHRNTWHGVLTPLEARGQFAVIDRIGEDDNLEEHWFTTPYTVTAPSN